MSLGKISMIAISALFVLLATACNGLPSIASNLPNIVSVLEPTSTPTVTPTMVPVTPTPEAMSTTAPATQNNPAQNTRAQIQAALLKATGLQAGVIRAINAGKLSIRLRTGADQVQTNASTLVVVPGMTNAQVSDIHTGDRVLIKLANGDATKTASLIMVVPSNLTADNVMLAAIQSNSQGTLQVRALKGIKDVTTSSSTLVLDLDNAQPVIGSVANLMPGNAIVMIGTKDDTSFQAQTIVVLAKDARKLLQQRRQNQPATQPTPGP